MQKYCTVWGHPAILLCNILQNNIDRLGAALEAGLAGTRAQSSDRYGSGTLHPRQVLGGSLPLLSPAFRRSHFRRQVPVSYKNHEKCRKAPGMGMDQAHKKQQSVVVVFKVFRNCDNRWYRVLSCDTLIESHL